MAAVLSISFSFHAHLRASEIGSCRRGNIFFKENPQLADFGAKTSTGCAIHDKKTGKGQLVSLSDDVVLSRLKRWIDTDTSAPFSEPLFNLSYAKLQLLFYSADALLWLEDVGYRLYSLRHGCTTYDWLKGWNFWT